MKTLAAVLQAFPSGEPQICSICFAAEVHCQEPISFILSAMLFAASLEKKKSFVAVSQNDMSTFAHSWHSMSKAAHVHGIYDICCKDDKFCPFSLALMKAYKYAFYKP